MIIKDRIVIFDLEATCDLNNPNYPKEIIEIGAVDNFSKQFNSFIKPIREPILTDFCKKLTSIEQSDIDNARSFPEVYLEFYDFFKGATLISWGAYDKKQLLADLKLNKMNLGVNYINENHINLKDLFFEKMGYPPRGMKLTMKQLGLIQDGVHHRGIDDAKNIKKIYNHLILNQRR